MTQVAPAHSARDRALDEFVQQTGAACVGGADIYVNWEDIDQSIAASKPNAGWIIGDLVFVGSLDQAVVSVDGVVRASEQSAHWVHAQKNGPKLMKFEQHAVNGVDAFLVRETFVAC